MMRDAIINFPNQFKWTPKIEGGKIKKYKRFLVCGMGGSHLAAGLLQMIKPDLDIIIHRSYGLPNLTEDLWKKRLVIISSYSGNTEEVIDGLIEAQKRNLPTVIITKGGKLLELAKQNNLSFVQIPDTGIQPRSSLGFQFLGLLKILKLSEMQKEIKSLAKLLSPKNIEPLGKHLAGKLRGHVPVIYASTKNEALAYNWKIKFNETGKIPAFYNTVPELNHNEMTGFDRKPSSEELSKSFFFIFLKDTTDHPRITKRFEILQKLYEDRGLPVEAISINASQAQIGAESILYDIFYSLLIADWAAMFTAESYGLESEQVPMVEEFKDLIK